MNPSEESVRDDYESQGFDVIHTGVPDFLLLKEGNIKFVEVKDGYNKLSSNQERAIDLLRKHGFEVQVKRLYTPVRRSTGVIGLRILKTLLSGETISPLNLAIKLNLASQTVRNQLSAFAQVRLVVSPSHGMYRLTELGRVHRKNIPQPSKNQKENEK